MWNPPDLVFLPQTQHMEGLYYPLCNSWWRTSRSDNAHCRQELGADLHPLVCILSRGKALPLP